MCIVINLDRHCDERAGASEEAIQTIARDGGKQNGSPRPIKNIGLAMTMLEI